MRSTLLFLLAGGLAATAGSIDQTSPIGSSPADTIPVELFQPGLVSTPLDELNAAFTPDQKELFWSVNSVQGGEGMGVIVVSRRGSGGNFGKAEVASFSGQYS